MRPAADDLDGLFNAVLSSDLDDSRTKSFGTKNDCQVAFTGPMSENPNPRLI
jgi:hypothetical protein